MVTDRQSEKEGSTFSSMGLAEREGVEERERELSDRGIPVSVTYRISLCQIPRHLLILLVAVVVTLIVFIFVFFELSGLTGVHSV